MGAVRRAERVVYVNFGIVCKGFAEGFVLFFFLPVEAEVFYKNGFTVFEIVTLLICVGADNVGCKDYFAVQKLVKSFRNGRKRKLFRFFLFRFFYNCFLCGFARVDLFLVFFIEFDFCGKNGVRLAHVRAKRDLRTVFQKVFDCGQRTLNSVFVGNFTVLHGYVEVAAYKHVLAL